MPSGPLPPDAPPPTEGRRPHQDEEIDDLEQAEGDALVRVLNGVALGLLVLFVSGVVTGALPLRRLDPNWQSNLCQSLINHSALPLTAFGLVHLAAFLAPLDERLAARRDALRQAAVAVVLGFLLLIPLQGWALWKGWSEASGGRAAGLQRARSQIEQLRRAIDTAGTGGELQQRLRSLRAPGVPAAELERPLPELKRLLEERLQSYQAQLERRFGGEGASRALQERLPAALRVVAASLGMALAWAAGAETPGTGGTLLERALASLDRPRRRPGRRAGAGGAVDQEFFEQLVEEDSSRQDPGA